MTNLVSFTPLRPHWLLLALLVAQTGQAASSILIWPINPLIEAEQKAAALWLENRGLAPVELQIRVLAWHQTGFEDQLSQQKQVVGSPPMATLQPGKRQLVRLVSLQPAAPGTLQSYRVLVDEVLPPNERPPELGVQFQMRYSVPLFVTGAGAFLDDGSSDAPRTGQPLAPQLHYRIVESGGQRFLYIRNQGSAHARLSQANLGQFSLANGLLGYVLPGAEMRWQLPSAAPRQGRLEARINEWKKPQQIQPE
ncbi:MULTISPECIES: molecular chaperone [unclassified Pseudomonas]|uniref:fimbrial biogenesis chaperone n=1 Tax=unclassified Pseudomonas TaxID=196821 RepID=UPI0024483688|nr:MULTISPECIES: molecular chaperone [unclassified Pseudomonas]MDG9924073.1 molecular chaperone [Pseudomonas sp. GD04045]MDH0036503.1 molecular chaperone [Pseudomonas sp. GD04019]